MHLGRLGIWSGAIGRLAAPQAREAVAEIEELGFGTLWYPESVGSKEALSQGALLLAWSEQLVVASGIASLWARDAMAMANGAKGLAEAYPGRFLLGIGVSTNVSVPMRGHNYERPFAALKTYLDAMDSADYYGPEPDPPARRVLASLGPRSLRLAAERSWGSHTYFVPPEHTSFARDILGPDRVLAVEQAVLLQRDPDVARTVARGHTNFYLARSAYRDLLIRLGFDEDQLENDGSDELIDAVVAWGDEAAIAARVQAHFDAGANHVCLQPLTPDPADVGLDQLRSLAPALGATRRPQTGTSGPTLRA